MGGSASMNRCHRFVDEFNADFVKTFGLPASMVERVGDGEGQGLGTDETHWVVRFYATLWVDDLDNPIAYREPGGDYYGYKHKESGLLHDLLGSEEAEIADEITLDEALERIERAAEEKGIEFYGWR